MIGAWSVTGKMIIETINKIFDTLPQVSGRDSLIEILIESVDGAITETEQRIARCEIPWESVITDQMVWDITRTRECYKCVLDVLEASKLVDEHYYQYVYGIFPELSAYSLSTVLSRLVRYSEDALRRATELAAEIKGELNFPDRLYTPMEAVIMMPEDFE